MSYPSLARRTRRIAPFRVMELVGRAAARQAAGHPVIHLSIGEPDFTAPPAVLDALEAAARAGRSRYTPANGTPALRAAIAGWYAERFGLDIAPARILVTAGASGALTLACCALIDPGDRVLLTDPGYPCNRHFVAAFDGEPVPVPVGPSTRFQMSRSLLEAHWGAKARGVLLSTPANPTGTTIAFDELGAIIDAVRERRGFALVDEIYQGLDFSGDVHSALSLGDDIIVANSFSKYFNMTGWRLGWLVVPEHLAAEFEKLAQNLVICPSALAQHAALACFTPQALEIFDERRDAFRARRDYIVPALRELGFGVPVEPDGAFYVYVDCSPFSDDSEAFCNELLEAIDVSLVPGTDFGVNQPQRYLRLSYATAQENLEEAVRRLRGYLAGRGRGPRA
ncbi:MAG: pyridoxal phosphate-dependent aminotransferase [Burkholderiaceae bacterium]